MKFTLFCILSALTLTVSIGQTKEIAHKSHSGSAITFDPTGDGNLGLDIPPKIDSIVKINDSTIIRYLGKYDHHYYTDTMINNAIWLSETINFDSIQNMQFEKIKFVGFEKRSEKEMKKKNRKDKSNNMLPISPSDGNNGLLILGISLICALIFHTLQKKSLQLTNES